VKASPYLTSRVSPFLNPLFLLGELRALRGSFFTQSIIPSMNEQLKFKSFGLSSLALIIVGWGGLYLLVTQTLPFVWPRWGFFVLMLMALTGTVLPIVYFFHQRFPGEKPAEAHVIVRQALWFGVYGATLAWLQLGRLVTVYVILGLAGGLAALEYFTRLREKSQWKPPVTTDDQSS
jgi:uncharacterized membrane protein YuzA (DUF378 family)